MAERVIDVTSSFEDLYEASYAPLVAGLTLLAGSPARAEDAAQEAYVRLYSRWSRVSRYDDPVAWVRRVAINLLRDDDRRRARVGPDDALLARADWDRDAAERIALLQAVSSLSYEHRQVLVLRHFFDLTMQAVAADLRVPVGTATSRLSRAHVALRAALDLPRTNQTTKKETADGTHT